MTIEWKDLSDRMTRSRNGERALSDAEIPEEPTPTGPRSGAGMAKKWIDELVKRTRHGTVPMPREPLPSIPDRVGLPPEREPGDDDDLP